MSETRCDNRRPALERGAVLARWFLGGLFVFMGLKKAMNPGDFLILVRQYDMVGSIFVLNSIAAALPWFETFCGLLLLAGIAVRGTAVMLVAMLIPFTIIVLRRALAIGAAKSLPFCMVKFDCGCGGGEVFICNKLLENTLLVLLSLWLIGGFGRKFALRYSLFGDHSAYLAKAPGQTESVPSTALTSAAAPLDSK